MSTATSYDAGNSAFIDPNSLVFDPTVTTNPYTITGTTTQTLYPLGQNGILGSPGAVNTGSLGLVLGPAPLNQPDGFHIFTTHGVIVIHPDGNVSYPGTLPEASKDFFEAVHTQVRGAIEQAAREQLYQALLKHLLEEELEDDARARFTAVGLALSVGLGR